MGLILFLVVIFLVVGGGGGYYGHTNGWMGGYGGSGIGIGTLLICILIYYLVVGRGI
jgi:hypothetical protein